MSLARVNIEIEHILSSNSRKLTSLTKCFLVKHISCKYNEVRVRLGSLLLAIGIELLSDYHSKSPSNRIIAMSDTNETYGAHLMKARPRLRIEITVDTSESLRTESEKRHAFDQKVNGPALDAFLNVQDSLDIHTHRFCGVSEYRSGTDEFRVFFVYDSGPLYGEYVQWQKMAGIIISFLICHDYHVDIGMLISEIPNRDRFVFDERVVTAESIDADIFGFIGFEETNGGILYIFPY